MDKGVLFGVGLAAAAAIGTVHYVSPADEPGDIPPLLVDAPPEAALARVRSVSLQQFLVHAGAAEDDLGGAVRIEHSSGTDEAVSTVWFVDERVLVIHVKARALDGRTELDVTAELPDSRLTEQPALHPFDTTALATIADFVVTDYLSSLFNSQRMANDSEAAAIVEAAIGLDARQQRELGQRFEKALADAYREDVEAIEHELAEDGASDWGSDDNYDAGYAADQAYSRADDARARAVEELARHSDTSGW